MFKAPASRERVEKSEKSEKSDLPERGRDREQKRVEKLPMVSNFSPFKPFFFVFPTKSSPYACHAKPSLCGEEMRVET
jgi:hypothetical protein